MRRLALGRFGTGVGVDQETRIARIEAALGEVELASHVGSVGDLPSTLVDPNADKPLYWSDKDKEFKFLNPGTGVAIDDNGNLTTDLSGGTGITVDGNTISIDLAEGAGIDIAGNTISVEPNLQTINALTFAADKLIRITGAPAADLIDFKMGLYTPVATLLANMDGATPLETMYVNIGLLVGVFGRINLDPAPGTTTSVVALSLPPDLSSNFANARDATGTASSDVNSGRIEADPSNPRVLLYFKSTVTTTEAFSFVFWYRILS